jgi:hypothetical protein
MYPFFKDVAACGTRTWKNKQMRPNGTPRT